MFLSPFFKKIGFLLIFINILALGYSQSSFDLGVKGDIGPAYFFNPNLSKSGSAQSYRFTLSDNYGVHMSLNLDQGSCLELDILPGAIRHGFSGSFGINGTFPASGMAYVSGESYTSTVQMNIIDIPFLYRYETKRGAFFEGGIGYEMISSVNYTAYYASPSGGVNENVSSQYPAGDFLLMGGIGKDTRIVKGSGFFFSYGARFAYGLLDLQGVDGHGQDLFGPSSVLYHSYNTNPSYYPIYHETRSFVVTVSAGIFYRFAPGQGHGADMSY